MGDLGRTGRSLACRYGGVKHLTVAKVLWPPHGDHKVTLPPGSSSLVPAGPARYSPKTGSECGQAPPCGPRGQASSRDTLREDFSVPPFPCCAAWVPFKLSGPLLLSTVSLKDVRSQPWPQGAQAAEREVCHPGTSPGHPRTSPGLALWQLVISPGCLVKPGDNPQTVG